ncbi:MAG: hypothetical protein CVU81_01305 [Euryarchaeota archaeon HGW-Euryarchaeota-1]|nr:MAG: hypothetical protein CVU81_01305 [Euryarchaeota archaeon HGW-Euryarchaeota-1]
MKVEIVSRTTEPYLKREKIEVKVFFEGEPIPSKQIIINELLSLDNSLKKEQIIIRNTETHYGQNNMLSIAHHYFSVDALKQTELDYIKKRNKIEDAKTANIQQTTPPVADENKK